jgi:hypothetical protein
MRKLYFSLLISVSLLISSFNLNAQTFTGDLVLSTQAQVDAFNYTTVTGLLAIDGNTITNLDGLSELTSVGHNLVFQNIRITNVDVLTNLESVGGFLSFLNCGNLTNLDGLSGLTSMGQLRLDNDDALTNVDGLSGTHMSAFNASLEITGNAVLSNLNGLSGFVGFHGNLTIENNAVLSDIGGLSGITYVENLTLKSNPLLTDISGLLGLVQIAFLDIEQSQFNNLDGLSNLTKATDITLKSNPLLANIDGLSGIDQTGGVRIETNLALTNIDGLSGLTKVTGILWIRNNDALTNLDGLSNLTLVKSGLEITGNDLLTDFCGLYNLFHSGTIGAGAFGEGPIIRFNGANTVYITAPAAVVVNADAGQCSAVVLPATVGDPLIDGCLEAFDTVHTDFLSGNIYPVGITNIIWTITDGAGNTATAIQTITVVDDQAPTITCPADTTVSCASDVPVPNVTAVAASDNCSYIVTHVSDDTTNKTCANRYILTRTYRATDPAGNSTDCSQVITVFDNVPPQITGLAPSLPPLWPPNHTMRDITLNYAVTDNCGNLDTTISIGSNESINGTGDGDTAPDWEIVDKRHIRLRAERAANGDGRVYTITVTVSDGCNSSVTTTTNVTVAHNITGPVTGHPFRIGSTVDFAGTFWDKPGNKHTATWLIDDNTTVKGSVSEPAGSKNGKAFGSYRFTTAGVYKLQMNITDQNKITSYANTNGDVEEIIVVYDPNGGYAYGGGWFNSPAGALKSNPNATGKVSYGFTTNYFKNSTYPKGETQFEFKVGNFEYNALNFDYLAISEAKAQFKGTGKIIDGQSGVNFIMTVIDGDLDGTGVDKIRMKIYNKNNGKIIYDNQPGLSDAALPTQAVGANSIIVISGTNSSLTSANTNQKVELKTSVAEVSNALDVIAYPNPAATNFHITVKANSFKEKIVMQVIDMYGRIVETRNVNANSVIRFGDRYRPGNYFVRIIQAKEHKEIKLVKLSD